MKFEKTYDLPDLLFDAALRDYSHNVLFLSAWGSETRIQELRARITLPRSEVNSLRSIDLHGLNYFFDNRDNLTSSTGRIPQSLLSHLTHVWVYHRLLCKPDYVSKRCALIKQTDEDSQSFDKRIWQACVSISTIPLLPSWDCLLHDFEKNQWVQKLNGFNVQGCLINLGSNDVETLIAQKLRKGELPIS